MSLSAVVDELAAAVSRVIVDEVELEAARTDRSGWYAEGRPLAIVRAENREQIASTLRIASARGVPVVVRGAGTGLSAGAAAGTGCIVLDVSGLSRILEIDPDNQLAVVECGVLTGDLDRAAGEAGLRYAPDPASAAISTVGGNIATNAGGLRGAMHGVTRDAVLGLEVVLADGRTLRTGRRTVKGVTGLDLTALLTGSEGTLGVIVEATVRLQPRPTETVTVAGWFADIQTAAAASVALTAARLQPAVLEIVDDLTIEAIDAHRRSSLRERGGAFLLAQTEGTSAADTAERIAAVFRRTARHVDIARDEREAQEIMMARREALPAMEARGRVLIEDIAVPRTRLAEAVAGIQAIARQRGVTIFTIGHAGDGNLHPIILVGGGEITQQMWDAAGDIFKLALDLGGTLTAEHGIGVLKRRWLDAELSPESLDLQRRIRAVFDPLGILNPGRAV